MTRLFPSTALSQAQACPSPLAGAEQNGRVALTIGLGLPRGGYQQEPAIIDTGSPGTYLVLSQIQGTAFQNSGLLTQITFPFVADTTSPTSR